MKVRFAGRMLPLGCCSVLLLQLGGCLPDYYFQNLLASSLSEIVSVILTDTLNVLLPAPTPGA